MGRWLSRDPIGERGGVGQYVFSDNSSVHKFDVLGLAGGPLSGTGVEIGQWPGPNHRRFAKVPDAVMASIIHVRANTRNVGDRTGLWEALDTLASYATEVESFNPGSPGLNATSVNLLTDAVLVKFNDHIQSGYADNLNELVHVFNFRVGNGIETGSRQDEAMAYSFETIIDANIELQKIVWFLEGGQSCREMASKAKSMWYSFWIKNDSPRRTTIASGYSGTASDYDFRLIRAELGARISCRLYSDILNSYVPKGCCIRFTCRNSGWIDDLYWDCRVYMEIPAGRPIDEVFK